MTVPIDVVEHHLPQAVTRQDERDEAFSALYDRYFPRIVAICRRRLPHEPQEDVEAIAQEAFARAWAAIDRFSGDRPFWPWLSTIARRLCVDHLRVARRDARAERRTTVDIARLSVEPEDIVMDREEMRAAAVAFDSLPERARRVVSRRELDGWTYEEIASFEGMSVEAVRGLLKRGRAAMRETFDRLAGGAAALPGLATVRAAVARMERSLNRWAGWGPLAALDNEAMMRLAAALIAVGLLHGPTDGPRSDRPFVASLAVPAPAPTDAPGRAPIGTALADSGAPRTSTSPVELDDTEALVAADAGPTFDAVEATSVHAAPDGSLYAIGSDDRSLGFMRVLFRSRDAGATWERLPATGFLGGRLHFPPDPADRRIFATSNLGLQLSTDQGTSFTTIGPSSELAAMSPEFSVGDPVILYGAAPGLVYDTSKMVTTPSGLRMPAAYWTTSFAFSRNYRHDATVFAGGNTFAAGTMTGTAVYVCRRQVCSEATRFDRTGQGVPQFALPRDPGDPTACAWNDFVVWCSPDRGATFAPVGLPRRGIVNQVVVEADRMYLAMTPWSHDPGEGGLFVSDDRGGSWRRLGATELAQGARSVVVLPGGRIVAVTARTDSRSLVWSDDGESWHAAR